MSNNTFDISPSIPKDLINNSTTTLQGQILLENQLAFVAPTTVAGTFYGIAVTLYCLYMYSAVARRLRNNNRRQTNFMLAHSTLVMICGISSLIAKGWITQDAYIKHSGFPGGPHKYTLSACHTHPIITFDNACRMLVDILTSSIQVWRVWVIWRTTGKWYGNLVTGLPLLSFLTFTALHMRSVILAAILPMVEAEQFYSKAARAADFALQGATTVFCTTLISGYLLYRDRQLRKLTGRSELIISYRDIVAMLVESYALETAWLLIVAVYFGLGFPTGIFFCATKTYIEIIAYLLVLYRVASGKAYESQRSQRVASSLRWNHSGHGATTQPSETGGTSNGLQSAGSPEADSKPFDYNKDVESACGRRLDVDSTQSECSLDADSTQTGCYSKAGWTRVGP